MQKRQRLTILVVAIAPQHNFKLLSIDQLHNTMDRQVSQYKQDGLSFYL